MALSRITSQREKRNFMVYDMEWYPGRAKVGDSEPTKLKENLRLVGSYDGHRYRAFYSVDDFLNATMTPANNEKWIYAHYGGMADAQFLLERLVARVPEFQVDASFSGSSAIIIHVKKGANVWHFIDSFWLLRDRLASIGAAIGLDKLGEEYACHNFPECGHVDALDVKYLDPGRNPHCTHPKDKRHEDFCVLCGKQFPHAMCVFWAEMGELKTYNERDCVILYKAIEQFEDVLMQIGGQLQMTIASCAMHLFRRVYLQDDIRTNAAVNGWARLAYTSSRVEVFQTRCHTAQYYDLNSSFPFAMTFPCPGNVKKGGLKDGKLPKDRQGSIFIADCEIEVPPMYLPPLPYRYDGRVFFPIGSWRSWFSGIDLELLERRGGRILKVHQSIEFEQQLYLRDYALDIYARRKASKTPFEKLTYKLLMNSLYGKFGERTEKTSMLLNPTDGGNCPHKVKHRCQSWPACEHAMRGVECNLCMAPLFSGAWLVTDNVPLAHEWVPIAVEITSRARMNLEGHLWYAQSDIFYCDSIGADRTVVLRSPNGDVRIEPVENAWKIVGGEETLSRGKEFREPIGWEALAMDSAGKEGWFPLKTVIRHKAGKEMWKISNKDGQTEVTSDHGLMLDARRKATPEAFVEQGSNFVKLKAPASKKVGAPIDLWDHVREASWKSKKSGPGGGGLTRSFALDGRRMKLDGLNGSGPLSRVRFRRKYKADSPEKMSLLRILAAYLTEGSASMRDVTTDRGMLSIAQNKKPWLMKLAKDLRVVAPEGHFDVLPTGNGMWAIRAGSAPFACFFAALGGYLSEAKKLPSFIYDLTEREFAVFWKKLVEGDGATEPFTGEETYTTSSQQLAAGLSYVLDQHGIEHRISYRTDKEVWSLGTRPSGSSRNRKTTKVERRRSSQDEYVYDLSVDGAHTFVDGIGRVLVHNTDSVITTRELQNDPSELGALKLEDNIENGEFVACKIYAVDVVTTKDHLKKNPYYGPTHWSTKAKGFSRMNYQKFCDVKIGEEIQIARMTRLRELFKKGKTSPEEAIVSKSLVQKCMPKRCMLPSGQSRPWMIDEIENNHMNLGIEILPPEITWKKQEVA